MSSVGQTLTFAYCNENHTGSIDHYSLDVAAVRLIADKRALYNAALKSETALERRRTHGFSRLPIAQRSDHWRSVRNAALQYDHLAHAFEWPSSGPPLLTMRTHQLLLNNTVCCQSLSPT